MDRATEAGSDETGGGAEGDVSTPRKLTVSVSLSTVAKGGEHSRANRRWRVTGAKEDREQA